MNENTAIVIVIGFVGLLFVYTVVSQVVYNWRCRRDAKLNAEYAAKREAMFRDEMGIISDPNYESPTSEDDRRWAERGVSRRR